MTSQVYSPDELLWSALQEPESLGLKIKLILELNFSLKSGLVMKSSLYYHLPLREVGEYGSVMVNIFMKSFVLVYQHFFFSSQKGCHVLKYGSPEREVGQCYHII